MNQEEKPKEVKCPYWIATVNFKDGTKLNTNPFYEYDEGFKVWSSEFSSKYKQMFDSISCEKVESDPLQSLQSKADLLVEALEESKDCHENARELSNDQQALNLNNDGYSICDKALTKYRDGGKNEPG